MMSQRLQLDHEQDLGQQQPRRTYTGRTPSDAADRRRVLTALCSANGRTSEASTLRAATRTRSRATVEQRWNGGRMNRPVCKRVQNLWRIEVDVIDDYDCCIELRRAYLEVTVRGHLQQSTYGPGCEQIAIEVLTEQQRRVSALQLLLLGLSWSAAELGVSWLAIAVHTLAVPCAG